MSRITSYSILIALSCIAYFNSLPNEFVFDDISAVVSNSDVRSNETSVWQVFQHDYWGTPIRLELSHKSYRPLTVLTFRLNYLFHGLEPMGYHFINVLLHAIVTLLFHNFSAKVIFANEKTSLLSSILFAVHPIHTEAVAGVVGRAELLSAVFYFLAFIAYDNRQLFMFSVYVICGLLSKEQAVSILGICFLYEILQLQTTYRLCKCQSIVRSSVKRLAWLTILGTTVITFRVWIMGGVSKFPVFTKYDNPASFAKFPSRHLTYNYLLGLNYAFLMYPFYLCCDWTMKSIPLISSWRETRNVITFLFYLTNFLLLRKGVRLSKERKARNHALLTIIAMSILPFLPASNFFVPVGFVLAERVLYLPSAGICLLVGYGFEALQFTFKKRNKLLHALYAITALCFMAKTITRNYDWSNELSLFTAGIKVNPNNAKLYNNIGHYYEKQRDWVQAIRFFEEANRIQPDDLGASINIARTFINMGQREKAEEILWYIKPKVKEAALHNSHRIVPSYLNLWISLGNVISTNKSRLREAEDVYLELISMRSDFVEAYINLGDVLIKQERVEEAIQVYKKALEFGQKTGDICYNLGVAHSLLMHDKSEYSGSRKTDSLAFSLQLTKIASYFQESLRYNINNKEAILNLAIMIQKHPNILSDFKEDVIERMIHYRGPDQERIWFNLALLFSDDSDNRTAEFYFRKAIIKKPDFKSALFNLALILIDEQRLFEAEMYLSQLVEYHPQHTKSLLLLGDIYIEFQEYDKAEECYLQVLKQNKTNVEAIHNLCIVYSKQIRMVDSKECYHKLYANPIWSSHQSDAIKSIVRQSIL